MRIASLVFLISAAALASAGGGPAVYVVGNLDRVSSGDEGALVLDHDAAVFRFGKTILSLPYGDMHSVVWHQSHASGGCAVLQSLAIAQALPHRAPMHQMVNFQFVDKNGNDQTMTLEFEEAAANQTLVEIEIRQGKHMPSKHSTNGDSWWGDSAWKTTRNNNTVAPESLGNTAGK